MDKKFNKEAFTKFLKDNSSDIELGHIHIEAEEIVFRVTSSYKTIKTIRVNIHRSNGESYKDKNWQVNIVRQLNKCGFHSQQNYYKALVECKFTF